jgi:hypothetical protein
MKMKVNYVIGHRPIDKTTGKKSVIFYGDKKQCSFREMKPKGSPFGSGDLIKFRGKLYVVMNIRITNIDLIDVWLYPKDAYHEDMKDGLFVDTMIVNHRISKETVLKVLELENTDEA